MLTVLIQTYLNFLGGSILALVLMNLTIPLLDNVGLRKPTGEQQAPELPKGEEFETTEQTECIRCGECMVACCYNLSPIMIKEAYDKNDTQKLKKLRADLCDGCGQCSYVCPARIDLKNSNLRARVLITKQEKKS